MDNHEDLISRQVEAIKGTLRTDVNNVNNEIEKFKLRWDAMKPKEENLDFASFGNVEANIKIIREKRKEWSELIERREKIQADHEHFGYKESIRICYTLCKIDFMNPLNMKFLWFFFCILP